jgi:hypothetical protein
MASAADIICDLLIKEVSDKYARKATIPDPHIATIRVDKLADAFKAGYIVAKNKFDDGSWPGAETLEVQGIFLNSAQASIQALYEWLIRPRTKGLVRPEDYIKGVEISWWMPRVIKSYYALMKREGLKIISKALQDEKIGNFIPAGQAFAQVTPVGGGYKEALEISAELAMGREVNILHKTTIGQARASAILQAVQRFTGPENFRHYISVEASKQITDWVGRIEALFDIGLTSGQVAQIKPKQPIKIEVGHSEINVEEEDFRFLKTDLRKIFKDLERKGYLKAAFIESGADETMLIKAGREIAKILASPTATKITKQPPLEYVDILYGKASKKKTSRKRAVPKGPMPKEKVRTVADDQSSIVKEVKENLILEKYLSTKLINQMRVNMHDPQLNWRTGRLANSVDVKVERTPKNRWFALKYTYLKEPYGVFDPDVGAPPWLVPGARDVRKLIEESLDQLMLQKKLYKFTTRRGN